MPPLSVPHRTAPSPQDGGQQFHVSNHVLQSNVQGGQGQLEGLVGGGEHGQGHLGQWEGVAELGRGARGLEGTTTDGPPPSPSTPLPSILGFSPQGWPAGQSRWQPAGRGGHG